MQKPRTRAKECVRRAQVGRVLHHRREQPVCSKQAQSCERGDGVRRLQRRPAQQQGEESAARAASQEDARHNAHELRVQVAHWRASQRGLIALAGPDTPAQVRAIAACVTCAGRESGERSTGCRHCRTHSAERQRHVRAVKPLLQHERHVASRVGVKNEARSCVEISLQRLLVRHEAGLEQRGGASHGQQWHGNTRQRLYQGGAGLLLWRRCNHNGAAGTSRARESRQASYRLRDCFHGVELTKCVERPVRATGA